MVIYADILFLINAIITYILLLSTSLIFKVKIKRYRVLISALVGGAYSLIILVDVNVFLGLLLKIIACSLIILISFGFKGILYFVKYTSVFLLLNFMLAGIVLAASLVSKKDFYSNMYVSYINISPLLLIISSVVAYVVISLFSKYVLTHINKNKIYSVKIRIENIEKMGCGYLDTGNSLSEPFSGYPVCVIKKGIIPNFDKLGMKRVIPFSSVGGDGPLYAVKGHIEIRWDKKIIETSEVYFAESEKALKNSQYDIILNPEVFNETEYTYEN